MLISMSETGSFLENCDNAYILVHQSPDGDCIGSGFALHAVLKSMGKKSAVICCDTFLKKFDYITAVENNPDFEVDKPAIPCYNSSCTEKSTFFQSK